MAGNIEILVFSVILGSQDYPGLALILFLFLVSHHNPFFTLLVR
jgi:hypothetical protein